MKSTVFKNNRTQAIRIPKALAFPDDVKEVEIVKHGRGLLIQPRSKRKFASWEEYFAKRTAASADFMPERDDPAPQIRKSPWD
jgi:antitoxin VapB